jgi:L-ascorbate metabolism protein UlaG (beta-lactamase superfamily)
MNDLKLRFTYIGGPTALIELGGLRFLTDPTFDPPGEYRTSLYVLRKTRGPAIGHDAIGSLDAVLLSHDQHLDNLDTMRRASLDHSARVLTTPAAAKRLGDRAIGLSPWQTIGIPARDGGNSRVLQITGTPARHGPVHADRGPVTGFVLAFADAPEYAVYISGDTVWHEGLVEVSRRFSIRVAVLFMGAARVTEVGPWHLTLTAAEGVKAAHAFSRATTIIPLHFEGWAHYSESRDDIEQAFTAAGLEHRLKWMEPGRPTDLCIH